MNFLCIYLGEGRGGGALMHAYVWEHIVSLYISVGVGAFVIGLSQISSFLSLLQNCKMDVYKTWQG